MALRMVFSSSSLSTILRLRTTEELKMLFNCINVEQIFIKSENTSGKGATGDIHSLAVISKDAYGRFVIATNDNGYLPMTDSVIMNSHLFKANYVEVFIWN